MVDHKAGPKEPARLDNVPGTLAQVQPLAVVAPDDPPVDNDVNRCLLGRRKKRGVFSTGFRAGSRVAADLFTPLQS